MRFADMKLIRFQFSADHILTHKLYVKVDFGA